MRTSLLVCAAAMGALALARRAEGQIPGVENPMERLLEEGPRVEVHPSVAALRCCSGEQRLDLAVWWPGAVDGEGLRLGLVGGVVSSGEGVFSRSGVEVGAAHEALGLDFTGAVGVGIGRGEGPRRVLSMRVGAALPAVALDVRTTWFDHGPADTALSASLPGPSSFEADRYTEAELLLRQRFHGVGARLTGGMRFGGDPGWVPHWLWGEIDVPVWRRLGLVLAGGERPDRRDRAQAGGRFAQLSVRWSLGPGDPEQAAAGEDDGEAPVEVIRLGAARYRLRLRVPDARTVELKGDVTDWEVLVMRRAGRRSDDWEVVLERPAGVYHINIRVDGGRWRAPPGLVPVPDRFGGLMGLLTLPTEEESDGNGSTCCGNDDGGSGGSGGARSVW